MLHQQQTLNGVVTCFGIGVHSGRPANLRICPAAPDHGIRFRRVDLADGAARDIPANADLVTNLQLCTTLTNAHGDSVSTIEHLMAALAGLNIDNALIEIDAAEVPIMDGSAIEFCDLFERVGIARQGVARSILRVTKPVEVKIGRKWARMSPADADTLRLTARIDFDESVIGVQDLSAVLTPGVFAKDIAFARTFGFAHEVDQLRALGFARGGSLDNAIVIEDGTVLNKGGLRCPDEFVRHKILDAVGDLALSGARIAGHYEAYCPGHALNNALLKALLADKSAWYIDRPVPANLRKSA